MTRPTARGTKYHGTPDLGMSRYFTLYLTQMGWLLLGVYLLKNAYWPSSCRPHGIVDIYTCSMRLPEGRGWVEAALFTWLWSTPILLALDALRRYRAWSEKRAEKAPSPRP